MLCNKIFYEEDLPAEKAVIDLIHIELNISFPLHDGICITIQYQTYNLP